MLSLVVAALLLLQEPAAQGKVDFDAQLAEGRRLAHDAEIAGDPAQYAKAKVALEAAAALDPASAVALYHLARVESMMVTNPKTDVKVQKQALAEGTKHCEAAVEKDAKCADAKALLGTLYGLSISRNFMEGPTLGPKSNEMLADALKLAPENPRAWVATGGSKLFTPPMFGGDPEEAVKDFEKAVGFADKVKADDDPCASGLEKANACAWLGRALEKVGRDEDAKKAYEKALAATPNYSWVKNYLLPELEKRLAKKDV